MGSRKKYPLKESIKEIIKDLTGIKTISKDKLSYIKLNYTELIPYYNRLIDLNIDSKNNNIVVIKAEEKFKINEK